MGRIKTVVLDFDGVLAESNEVKDAAFGEFFQRYPEHAVAMQAYHREYHAQPRRVKFAYLVEELMQRPRDTGMIDCLTEEFSALVAERVIACPEVPGAGAFLAEFAPLVPLYISSVTPQNELDWILAVRKVAPHIRRAFGNPPYSKDAAIGNILEREGLDPSQVAFVGDSESDCQVARLTGLEFYGRDSGQPFTDPSLCLSEDMYAVADKLRALV